MDIYVIKIVVDNWVSELDKLGCATPETFINPIKFATDLGGLSYSVQLAIMGRMSVDLTKRVFTTFSDLHKQDIMNLHNAIQDLEND